MEKNFELNNPEQKTKQSNTSFWKVLLIFSLVMIVLLAGVNYLFSYF